LNIAPQKLARPVTNKALLSKKLFASTAIRWNYVRFTSYKKQFLTTQAQPNNVYRNLLSAFRQLGPTQTLQDRDGHE